MSFLISGPPFLSSADQDSPSLSQISLPLPSSSSPSPRLYARLRRSGELVLSVHPHRRVFLDAEGLQILILHRHFNFNLDQGFVHVGPSAAWPSVLLGLDPFPTGQMLGKGYSLQPYDFDTYSLDRRFFIPVENLSPSASPSHNADKARQWMDDMAYWSYTCLCQDFNPETVSVAFSATLPTGTIVFRLSPAALEEQLPLMYQVVQAFDSCVLAKTEVSETDLFLVGQGKSSLYATLDPYPPLQEAPSQYFQEWLDRSFAGLAEGVSETSVFRWYLHLGLALEDRSILRRKKIREPGFRLTGYTGPHLQFSPVDAPGFSGVPLLETFGWSTSHPRPLPLRLLTALSLKTAVSEITEFILSRGTPYPLVSQMLEDPLPLYERLKTYPASLAPSDHSIPEVRDLGLVLPGIFRMPREREGRYFYLALGGHLEKTLDQLPDFFTEKDRLSLPLQGPSPLEKWGLPDYLAQVVSSILHKESLLDFEVLRRHLDPGWPSTSVCLYRRLLGHLCSIFGDPPSEIKALDLGGLGNWGGFLIAAGSLGMSVSREGESSILRALGIPRGPSMPEYDVVHFSEEKVGVNREWVVGTFWPSVEKAWSRVGPQGFLLVRTSLYQEAAGKLVSLGAYVVGPVASPGETVWVYFKNPGAGSGPREYLELRVQKGWGETGEERGEERGEGDFPYAHLQMPPPQEMMETLRTRLREVEPSGNYREDKRVWRNVSDFLAFDGLSSWFTERERMKCSKYGKKSPLQHWLELPAEVRESHLRDVGRGYKYMQSLKLICDILSPYITAYVILDTAGRGAKVLDPSAGWGDRLIAAIAAEASLYHGVDPNESLQRGYGEIVRVLGGSNPQYRVEPQYFEDWKIEEEFYDVAITSPPYYTLERYEGARAYADYQDWLNRMYYPYLDKMYRSVRVGGWLAIYVQNIRVEHQTYPLSDDTADYLDSRGLIRVGNYGWKTEVAPGKVRNGVSDVMCWYKGAQVPHFPRKRREVSAQERARGFILEKGNQWLRGHTLLPSLEALYEKLQNEPEVKNPELLSVVKELKPREDIRSLFYWHQIELPVPDIGRDYVFGVVAGGGLGDRVARELVAKYQILDPKKVLVWDRGIFGSSSAPYTVVTGVEEGWEVRTLFVMEYPDRVDFATLKRVAERVVAEQVVVKTRRGGDRNVWRAYWTLYAKAFGVGIPSAWGQERDLRELWPGYGAREVEVEGEGEELLGGILVDLARRT